MPIIAVFTQYDRVISHVKRNMDPAFPLSTDDEGMAAWLKEEADAIVQRECIEPFEKLVKKQVPHMTISSEYPLIHHLWL